MKHLKNTHRVSVTLPTMMIASFLEDARISNLSLSRVIYLILKSRKPTIIAGPILSNDIKMLADAIDQLKRNGQCDAHTINLLQENVQIIRRLVEGEKENKNESNFKNIV
ncbi:MAG: hypothetical protein LKI76_04335 [Megasphaera sp.]|jgi:hypothetical protein|nr:hypothetical protein [Megasphaera sp.]